MTQIWNKDETCVQCTAPSGTTYFFSTTSGKIWKRVVAGSIQYDKAGVATNIPRIYSNGTKIVTV